MRDPVIEITGTKLLQEEIKLYPQLKKDEAYVKLIFKDDGIGFDQKYAGQIFNIFQRLNTRESFPGSGVGLALCKKIVENHHGIIMAESEPSQGTTITVILPS
jgi:signal transduction histidine kinase